MKTGKKHKSAVKEIAGKNPAGIPATPVKKTTKYDTGKYIEGILHTDIPLLSRAITLVESENPVHREQAREIIRELLPYSGKSIRIGITGVPGVGKSTFIDTFGSYLTARGHKLAVLAVDPSSSISRGSILGDKTRMDKLIKNPSVYIRPSASGKTAGGVHRRTRESIVLCEAAGFDVILIETVGVGQSETAVRQMTDFFILLKLAGAGDELQGIKRGIMEMADLVIIHKADGDNLPSARMAQNVFSNALHLFPPKEGGWTPPVLLASAVEKTGMREIWETVEKFVAQMREKNIWEQKRIEQEIYWLYETLNSRLLDEFYENPDMKREMEKQMSLLKNHRTTPYEAADSLMMKIKKGL